MSERNAAVSPVVIGGIGGSGTRLIAQCLGELGFFMGTDLNVSNDNLWFTFLFKRFEILRTPDEEFNELVEILVKRMTGIAPFTKAQVGLINSLVLRNRAVYSESWVRERSQSLLSQQTPLGPVLNWGWKEPNSHIVIDRLRKHFPLMKYIHVARNGLDMAYSSNQKQLKLWGIHFVGEHCEMTPYYSLKYWSVVHRRIFDLCCSMNNNFYFLNYDDFCLQPEKGVRKLVEFLGLTISDEHMQRLINFVRIPESMGRFKKYMMDVFDRNDIEYVKQLGFDTHAEEKKQ